MKKLILFLLLITAVAILANFSTAQSSISTTSDPGDVSQVLAEEFGLNKSQIPTDPEDIRQIYLQQEWTKIISNNKILGPIHNFFTKISIVFQILFAHPYELSLTLFFIIVLWLFVLSWAARFSESKGILKGWKAFFAGISVTVIVAQTRAIKFIVTFFLDLIFKQENWWIRVIIFVLAFGFLAVAHILTRLLNKYLEGRKKEKKEKKSEQREKRMEALEEGIKEIEEQPFSD